MPPLIDDLKRAAEIEQQSCEKCAATHNMGAFDYHRGVFDGIRLAVALLTGEDLKR